MFVLKQEKDGDITLIKAFKIRTLSEINKFCSLGRLLFIALLHILGFVK